MARFPTRRSQASAWRRRGRCSSPCSSEHTDHPGEVCAPLLRPRSSVGLTGSEWPGHYCLGARRVPDSRAFICNVVRGHRCLEGRGEGEGERRRGSVLPSPRVREPKRSQVGWELKTTTTSRPSDRQEKAEQQWVLTAPVSLCRLE